MTKDKKEDGKFGFMEQYREYDVEDLRHHVPFDKEDSNHDDR